MSVQRAVDTAGNRYTVTGHGYEPSGVVVAVDGGGASAALVPLARAGVLCNDAALLVPDDERPSWRVAGDPLEAALITFAERCGVSAGAERAKWPRVAEEPFDQETRRMVTVHRDRDGRELIVCKGAPEAVLVPPLVVEVPDGALDAAAELAQAGLRVLAVASRLSTGSPGRQGASEREQTEPLSPRGLWLLGLVGVGDPVQTQAPDIAQSFHDAGIRLVLITGDHPGTAAAVAGRVGIWSGGDDMHHGDEGSPDASLADGVRVFARIPPDQKLDIVAVLQQRGHVVAMTGDGVNDAPALRQADIGVAMGGGSEVARQAADLVLTDDNLGTVTTAVREGRRIYDNIRRFLLYGLAGGFAELAVMLAGPYLGLAVPLLPAQILWVNPLTHGVPGVALGAEPPEPGTMRRQPRAPTESVLGGGLAWAAIRTGMLLAATVLTVGVLAAHAGRPWQSMVFVVLGLAQLGVAVAVRARRVPGGERNRMLPAALVLSAGLQLAGVFLPGLRHLLARVSGITGSCWLGRLTFFLISCRGGLDHDLSLVYDLIHG